MSWVHILSTKSDYLLHGRTDERTNEHSSFEPAYERKKRFAQLVFKVSLFASLNKNFASDLQIPTQLHLLVPRVRSLPDRDALTSRVVGLRSLVLRSR